MGLCGRKVEDDVGALSCISMALSVLVMQIYINISNYKPIGIKKSHFLSLSRRFRRFFVVFTQMTQISQIFLSLFHRFRRFTSRSISASSALSA